MFCTNCGKELESRDMFCVHCGARQELVQSTHESSATPVLPVSGSTTVRAVASKRAYSYRPKMYWLCDMIAGLLCGGIGLPIMFFMESRVIGGIAVMVLWCIYIFLPDIKAVFYSELTLVGEKKNIPVLAKKTVWGVGDYKAKYNDSGLTSILWSKGRFSKAVYEIGNGGTIVAYYEEYTTNCNEAGVYAIRIEFDSAGNSIRCANYGMFGQLKKDRYGVAIYEYEYDSAGNMTRSEFYGADGRLKEHIDGLAIVEYEYDSAGNMTRMANYGADGRLKEDTNGVAIYEYEYDSVGNIPRTAVYGTDGRLKEATNGFAIIEREYDSAGNMTRWATYGANGRLKENTAGCAIVEYEYDSAGNMTRGEFYGADGHLKEDTEGVAIIEREYDSTGNMVAGRCYGAKGKFLGIWN